MRLILIILGAALLVGGIWIVAGSGTYQSTETVLQIGSASLKATEEKAIPQWLGIAGIAVGGVLTLAGLIGLLNKK